MAGYFDFEFNAKLATKPVHTLNRPYKGARQIKMRAPDAGGTLIVWARSEEEARDHLANALFDLIFNKNRCGVSVENPACIFCGAKTQSHGRNSSGTRTWRCQNPECQRHFVIDRTFRGGINHPSQSKKPKFTMLVKSGVSVREAADRLGLGLHTASNWAQKLTALGVLADVHCPCGKTITHRGSCAFRMEYSRQRRADGRYLPAERKAS